MDLRYTCMTTCMCVCVCVCVCVRVCVLPSCDWYPALLGCKFTGHSSIVSYGSRWDFGCPHPQAERYGQSSCEFLARLQEFACTGSQCLLSAQASLALPGARDHVVAAREFSLFGCVCMCCTMCVYM